MPKHTSSVLESEKSDRLLLARLEDLDNYAQRYCYAQSTHFLNERQQNLLASRANSLKLNFMLYGGYEEAERKVLTVFPSGFDAEPAYCDVCAVTAEYPRQNELSHRDFLGTLTAGGIKRECIGDILTQEGRCVFFVTSDLVEYCTSQICRIGGVSVTITEGYNGTLPVAHEFDSISATVASPRLDCVVKALINCSRESAAELITHGLVTLCGVEQLSVSATVGEGDKISIRRHGKFIIDAIGQRTRKGRICLNGRKYR